MTFLCNHHRQQVLTEVTTALSFWEQWMQQGAKLFNQRQWHQAACYLGSSFEVAEWLLAKPELVQNISNLEEKKPSLNYFDRYMIAGHHLSECLGRNGQIEAELHYLLTVHLKLLNTVKAKNYQHQPLKNHLEISLAMLGRHCKMHGQFKGYQDCYLETRLCIDQCTNPVH